MRLLFPEEDVNKQTRGLKMLEKALKKKSSYSNARDLKSLEDELAQLRVTVRDRFKVVN